MFAIKRSLLPATQSALTLAFALGISSSLATTAAAQGWAQAGLEVVWKSQVDAPQNDARKTEIGLHVSRRHVSTAYEVIFEGGSRLFAPQHVDRYGVALGQDGAAHMADVEMRVLKSKGIESEIVEHTTPRVTLFAQSTNGMLQAINAETGELLWKQPVGRADFPNLVPAANDDYAIVINGSTMYAIDLTDGKLAFQRRLSAAPGAGPAVTDQFVFVPLLNGMLEGYRLAKDEQQRPPLKAKSIGNSQVRPVVTGKTVSWPTDRGYLYVSDAETGKIRFRMEARSELVAQSAFMAPDRLFVASIEGYLFCIDEQAGNMVWQFSAGESLAQSPYVAGDLVLVVSERGGIFAVHGKTGVQAWEAKGVQQVVSASDDRVYCLDLSKRLVVLDRESGNTIARSPGTISGQVLTNTSSDRVYVVSPSGQLTCLRQENQQRPTIHGLLPETTEMAEVAVADEVADTETEAVEELEETDEAADEDPFSEDGDFDDGMDDGFDEGDESMDEDPFEVDDEDIFGEDEEF